MSSCGFVFGATGELYRKLARRAARNVRAVMPGLEIDLYTDAPLDDPIFTQVHVVPDAGIRPKMRALRLSRFDRTLYLDCDVVMLNDVSDVFACLAQADIVGAHEQFGSSPIAMQMVRKPVPTAFRQINSGVIGIRKSTGTDEFLRRWEDDFRTLGLRFDQPLLRELLFDSDLRLIVLPSEYNLMYQPHIRVSNKMMMAPRLLHIPGLHEDKAHAEPADQPFDVGRLVSPVVATRYAALLGTDRTLGAGRDLRTVVADTVRHVPRFRRFARRIEALFRPARH